MERLVLTETWLDRKPNAWAGPVVFWLGLLLFASALLFWGSESAQAWMLAKRSLVLTGHEYHRLFTTLFAHADLGHLLSNALLFLPLTYALARHFSFLFLLMGFASAGLVNLFVLYTLPPHSALLGISGLVYWLGSAWLTLYLLLERRQKLRRRFGAALFLTLILFVPETLRPEVSYLSHFVGYMSGVAGALFYYTLARKKFRAAEKWEMIQEPPLPQEEAGYFQYSQIE
jgi:rhomboid protease GluP